MSTTYRHWTDLIKPKQLELEEKTLTPTYGKFYAEPFERGFGQTIGNSLRRVLLSSLMGAAIVAVRIKGILHEFSTIPGITEDVTDIILNLKEVRLRFHDGEQQTLKIDAKGPKTVQAKDIVGACRDFEPGASDRDAFSRRETRDGTRGQTRARIRSR